MCFILLHIVCIRWNIRLFIPATKLMFQLKSLLSIDWEEPWSQVSNSTVLCIAHAMQAKPTPLPPLNAAHASFAMYCGTQ